MTRSKTINTLAAVVLAATLAAPGAEPVPPRPETHATFKAASDAATADQSLVLLVFSATWCGVCKKLQKETLDSPEFLQRGGSLHIADVDVDADGSMARAFGVQGVPTLVLLTGEGKIVTRQTGFVTALEVMLWIEKARTRAKAGEWEGTAPGAKVNEFIARAAGPGLSTNDLDRVIALLAEADPADRSAAATLILAERERAVPGLIAAAGDPYLGLRIAAVEVLQQLAPDAPVFDPWQAPSERTDAVVALKQWWARTGTLPAAGPARADPGAETALKEMIEAIRSGNPASSTEAMAGLVRQGATALPMIREAIGKGERAGDRRSVALLEDVRWTILIPDALERRAGGVRAVLARGKSTERQSAALLLGRAGAEGLTALTELLGDSDSLVVESAVRAISGIGGADVIPALSALLRSGDSNVRMTAAQALGRTKNPAAVKPLLLVFTDPNEVIACTALSALEEVRSGGRLGISRQPLPPEATAALRSCLSDVRWRVRATAAEVIGKTQLKDLAGDVKGLLEDADPFVVKNALAALSALNAAPDAMQLAALGKRLPSLRADTIEMMIVSGADDAIKLLRQIYDSGSVSEQLAILNALAQHGELPPGRSPEDGLEPLLARATTATDARLRQAGASVLVQASPTLAAKFVGPLLADDDPLTRSTAAGVVLHVMNAGTDSSPSARPLSFSRGTTVTNTPVATPEQMAAWHAAIAQHVGPDSGLNAAAALFVTGDGRSDLPLIENALTAQRPSGDAQRQQDAMALSLIVSKLPWPEGRPLLEKLCASPLLFAMALKGSGRAAPGVADYLLEPARFKGIVEPLVGRDLSDVLELLAGHDYSNVGWSLWTESDRTRAADLALVESTNAAWRSAAIFSLGLRENAAQDTARLEKAMADADPWVRAAAVQGIARRTKGRAVLDAQLAPLLADTNLNVAVVAACGLLEPELRQAANIEDGLTMFRFQEHVGSRSENRTQTDDRPLTVLPSKPSFLASARKWLAGTNDETLVFALLLAQYGEFDGIDALLPRYAGAESARDSLLAGIALSRDAKYIPALRKLAAESTEWELRNVLQALKGMTGPEARQLRLEINKRMRDAGDSAGGIRIE